MRRHNEPGCPCDWPILCGLTPRWVDRMDGARFGEHVLLLVVTVYSGYVLWAAGPIYLALFGVLLAGALVWGFVRGGTRRRRRRRA